ncbi:hypothetical protein STEG23_004645, partial [Scotinomys teguina]
QILPGLEKILLAMNSSEYRHPWLLNTALDSPLRLRNCCRTEIGKSTRAR